MSTELTPGPNRKRNHCAPSYASLVLGVGLALLGAALLASNLGWLDLRHLIWRFWPTILIVAGAAILLQRRTRQSLWGFVLIFWGFWIYADQLNWIRVNFWAVFGPTLLLLIGGTLVYRAVSGGHPRDGGATTDSYIRTYAVLSGSDLRPQSTPVTGAEITAIMGGVKLDLTNAQLEGDTAVVDVFALMGGIEIYAPREWEVVNKVAPVMGAYVDKRRPAPSAHAKTLIVRGTVVMGGIEVKD